MGMEERTKKNVCAERLATLADYACIVWFAAVGFAVSLLPVSLFIPYAFYCNIQVCSIACITI